LYSENVFPNDVEDYFLMFEDQCTQSHACAGKVRGVLSHIRKKLIDPPSYDQRSKKYKKKSLLIEKKELQGKNR
jgi:hypothetical protein